MKPAPAGPPASAHPEAPEALEAPGTSQALEAPQVLEPLAVTVPAGFAPLRGAGIVSADLEMCR
jgi:hypothetical protein